MKATVGLGKGGPKNLVAILVAVFRRRFEIEAEVCWFVVEVP